MGILSLAEDSLETSSLIFSEKHETYLWLSSAAVVIGVFRVKVSSEWPEKRVSTNEKSLVLLAEIQVI